jgi:hypothetical protein
VKNPKCIDDLNRPGFPEGDLVIFCRASDAFVAQQTEAAGLDAFAGSTRAGAAWSLNRLWTVQTIAYSPLDLFESDEEELPEASGRLLLSRRMRAPADPQAGERLHVFQNAAVLFHGQPMAVLIAETQEQVDTAASSVQEHYETAAPLTEIDPDRGRASSEPSTPEVAGLVETAFRLR